MTAEQQLERSVLEGKEHDELSAIAQAMSLKTTTRTKKADIIDRILDATGVTSNGAATNGESANGDSSQWRRQWNEAERGGPGERLLAGRVTRSGRNRPPTETDSGRAPGGQRAE